LFISRAPGDLAEMKSALKNIDYEKIRITAHSMKSQLKFNGIVSGYDIAEMIEHICLENSHNETPQLIQKREEICGQAIDELKVMKF
jgi:HPt (histidine-containing phosphotransfer) domain-containing protein